MLVVPAGGSVAAGVAPAGIVALEVVMMQSTDLIELMWEMEEVRQRPVDEMEAWRDKKAKDSEVIGILGRASVCGIFVWVRGEWLSCWFSG